MTYIEIYKTSKNVTEMDEFLNPHGLPELNQEVINSLNNKQ